MTTAQNPPPSQSIGLPDHAGIEQEEVDRAEAGEHLLHPDGADEGRQDQGDEQEARHQALEGKLVAVHDPGHRDGQERREQRDGEGEVDAVEDELPVRGVGEHEEKDREGETGAAGPVGDGEGLGEGEAEGIEEKCEGKACQDRQEEQPRNGQVIFTKCISGHRSSRHRSLNPPLLNPSTRPHRRASRRA